MIRLLVTGGSSYLGQHLVPLCPAAWEVIYTYYSSDPLALPGSVQLDLRNKAAVLALVRRFRPEIIMHLAGSNRPPETMEAVISQGTQHIVAAAGRAGARLVHLSTDVIFDGRQPPYRESDMPTPLHAYGRAKAAAEALVRRHEDSVIVRTSLIYGLEKMDRGTEWMVETLRAGRPVTLFTDQVRNPVWATSLSQACLEVAQLPYRGMLHIAGRQHLSRAAFALKMLAWWGVDTSEGVHLASSDPERWPRDCRLDITLAQSLLKTPLPGVDEVLTRENLNRTLSS